MRERVTVVLNPAAGSGRAGRAGDLAVSRLRELGAVVETVSATSPEQASRLAADAVDRGTGALVVVGGDGSVHLGANVVAGTATPLGLIPAGTGNDIARELGLPRDPAEAAAVVLDGAVQALDVVRAGDRCFVGVLCGGFDAAANARADRMRWPRGRLRYVAAAMRELSTFRPLPYEISIDDQDEPQEIDAMLVAVGNFPAYGGGLRICHGARPDDGLLDLVVATRMTRRRLLRLLPKAYRGDHLADPAVQVRRVRRVSLYAPGVVAYADGERIGALPLACEVLPGALRVIVSAPRTVGP